MERVCVDAGRGVRVEHAVCVRWEGICGQGPVEKEALCVASRGRRRVLGGVSRAGRSGTELRGEGDEWKLARRRSRDRARSEAASRAEASEHHAGLGILEAAERVGGAKRARAKGWSDAVLAADAVLRGKRVGHH